MSKYETYKARMRKLADINHSIAVLSWDKEVNLPEMGANLRSQQIATLSGISHELFTEKEFGDLLADLNEDQSLNAKERKNIFVTLDEYEKATKFDQAFVIRKSQLISNAYHAWLKARKENDFKYYEEALNALVVIKIEEAKILGFDDHPYDALLDQYEPGAKVKKLDVLFQDVRDQLVPFIQKVRSSAQVSNEFLHQFYPQQKQWDYGLDLLKNMGYDFEKGRQDLAPHPFTITFSAQDVRVTTRVDENDLANMIWSCIHEGGHALYEQGLNIEEYGLPTGNAISLSIHESQSRLWENHVGRSRGYWAFHFPTLQKVFPGQLTKVSLDDFYKGINRVEANLIRTEADELHYHFHVMIRYELEKRLINGDLQVSDLRDSWNEMYKKYLGVDVPNDNKGVLQDVHWGHGSFGYFPTYSLGSFYAAQFFATAVNQIEDYHTKLEKGDTADLLKWLRKNIHQYGRQYEADELCERITGEGLNFKYFMEYAEKKYKAIYNLT